MRGVRPGALKYYWRQGLPATITGGLGLGLLSLFWPDVLTSHTPWPGLIVLAQCLLLSMLFGRCESSSFAYLYSRGYSRDSLWKHMLTASALSVLATWLLASLIIWTGARSLLHDQLLHSPYFPIMAPRETWVPLVWFGLYLLLVPACHYAWIRRAQPTRGGQGGSCVVAGLLVTLLVGFNMVRYLDGWFAWLSGALYVVTVTCLVLGGRTLHRSLEVRA